MYSQGHRWTHNVKLKNKYKSHYFTDQTIQCPVSGFLTFAQQYGATSIVEEEEIPISPLTKSSIGSCAGHIMVDAHFSFT